VQIPNRQRSETAALFKGPHYRKRVVEAFQLWRGTLPYDLSWIQEGLRCRTLRRYSMTTQTDHQGSDFAHNGTMQAIAMTVALLALTAIAFWVFIQ
jgi:hypothetical protein